MMRVKTDEYLKDLTENNRDAAFNAAEGMQLPVTRCQVQRLKTEIINFH